MNTPYDDIIGLPHPISAKRPHMPMIDRAAQFSPFQALTGYGATIRETERLTDQKIELAEEEQALLDGRLRRLADTGGEAVFTWFRPDEKKSGGAYTSATGRVKRLDSLRHTVMLEDGTTIPIEDILEIEDEAAASSLSTMSKNRSGRNMSSNALRNATK